MPRMHWLGVLAALMTAGCGLTIDVQPPATTIDAGDRDAARGARDAGPPQDAWVPPVDGATPDGGPDVGPPDVGPDATPCMEDVDCASLTPEGAPCPTFKCVFDFCLPDDADGDGLGAACDCEDGDELIRGSAERGCIPAGSVGACGEGAVEVCVDGRWGECLGGRRPVVEHCNDLDDDCDGSVDEGLTGAMSIASGCSSVTCTGGELREADAVGAEICGNGVDDDCDGEVDEDCYDCLFVAPFPIGSDLTGNGSRRDPLRTIDAALSRIADEESVSRRICLAGGGDGGCGRTVYDTSLVADVLGVGGIGVPQGVHIVGGYGLVDDDVVSCPPSVTAIKPPDAAGVTFLAASVPSPGSVSGMSNLTVLLPTEFAIGIRDLAGITIEEGADVTLSNVFVRPDPVDAPRYPRRAYGVEVQRGARLTVLGGAINPGTASTEATGIAATGAVVELRGHCDTADCRVCDGGSTAAVFGGNGGWAVKLNEDASSSGSELRADEFAFCGRGGGGALRSVSVSQVQAVDSLFEVAPPTTDGAVHRAIHLRACRADSWIHDSEVYVDGGEGTPADHVAVDVDVVGSACALTMTDTTVVGLRNADANSAIGVRCAGGATCALLGNRITGASEASYLISGGIAKGVECDRGCSVLYGNAILGTLSTSALVSIAASFDERTVLVSGNRFAGGCAGGSNVGIDLTAGQVRLENNVVVGTPGCALGGDQRAALVLGSAGADVDSNANTYDAGGADTSDGECSASGLVVESEAVSAVFRNDVFAGGAGCPDRAAMRVEALAQRMSHVALTQDPVVLYRGTRLVTLAELEALPWVLDTVLLETNPRFRSAPNDHNLRPASPLVNTGTRAGAPVHDHPGAPTVAPVGTGVARPPNVSIGAYEDR